MKKNLLVRWLALLLVAVTLLTGCMVPAQAAKNKRTLPTEPTVPAVTEEGEYSSKEEVAYYIYLYGHLPPNYITKAEAQELGWVASKGNLWKVAPGMSIGGDRFGNREGLLPKAKGRQYYECDIDFDGKYRNEKRIVFSTDGLIYYTGDHYESFERLYEGGKTVK